MSQATCDNCYPLAERPPGDGYTIHLCPLHAAAPALREVLRLLHNEVQRSGQLGVNAPLRFADEQADKALTLAEQTP